MPCGKSRKSSLTVLSSTSFSDQSHHMDKAHSESKVARVWQKTYGGLGFSKAYNFVLFFIFAGAMVGFVLARFQYLAIGTVFAKSSSPGEWYWYRAGFYRVGITMHLGACIPAGFLLVWQFVPWIRYHAMLFHRINGWTVSCLIIVSNVGALMIARRSFGGTVASQTSIGLLAILTTVGIGMAIYNVKRLQIDQHRAWMLRTAFWLGTIITMRLIMIISALIAAHIGTYYSVATCGEVMYVDGGSGKALYPQCWQDGATADLVVAVRAAFDKSATATQIGSSLKIGFPTGLWLAIFLHTVGVEIYLNLTPREAARLRQVSYEKQKAAGLSNPGSSGLTVDRWGDSDPWMPAKDLETKAADK